MKKFTVIGLGKFGFMVAKSLFKSGNDVIVIDKDKEKIQAVQPYSSETIIADATDKKVLEKLELNETDAVVISLGRDVSASILTTLYLRDLNVKKIVVKADSEDHGRALSMIGATDIIFPERDMAEKLAESLISPNILDFLTLSPEYSIVELAAPKEFVGKTLSELDLRKHYGINVLAVRDVLSESMTINPAADFVIKDSDLLISLAKIEDVEKIK